jgi:hypothetical protein
MQGAAGKRSAISFQQSAIDQPGDPRVCGLRWQFRRHSRRHETDENSGISRLIGELDLAVLEVDSAALEAER